MDVMKQSYSSNSKISKKDILLTSEQAKKIQQYAKIKLKSKKFKMFKATKAGKTLGFGLLVNRKVRSKNAAVLYIISKDSVLKSMEIIAFNEPMEYIPSKKWIQLFENIKKPKNMPNITGATMSAKAIVDGSKIAFSIYNEMLKDK